MGKRRLVLRLSDDNWLNVVAIVVAILGLNNCSSIGEDDDDDNNTRMPCRDWGTLVAENDDAS
jgi:hypothetical protein